MIRQSCWPTKLRHTHNNVVERPSLLLCVQLRVFIQQGRVATTVKLAMDDTTDIALTSSVDATVTSAAVYPMGGIWVSEDDVRHAARVYN